MHLKCFVLIQSFPKYLCLLTRSVLNWIFPVWNVQICCQILTLLTSRKYYVCRKLQELSGTVWTVEETYSLVYSQTLPSWVDIHMCRLHKSIRSILWHQRASSGRGCRPWMSIHFRFSSVWGVQRCWEEVTTGTLWSQSSEQIMFTFFQCFCSFSPPLLTYTSLLTAEMATEP